MTGAHLNWSDLNLITSAVTLFPCKVTFTGTGGLEHIFFWKTVQAVTVSYSVIVFLKSEQQVSRWTFFFFFFGRATRHAESSFPDHQRRSDLCPLRWKCGVLTTGLPGNSEDLLILACEFLKGQTCAMLIFIYSALGQWSTRVGVPKQKLLCWPF